MATTAAQRGWGPGWPNCNTSKWVTIRRSDGVVLPVRVEVKTLIAWLCDETERRGYNLVPGWCWGAECRQIRQTGIASNHSWGLAVDLNAPTNPATNDGRVHRDMPQWVVDLWGRYGFRNGADYSGSFKDPMHMEFMGTPADAARYTASIDVASKPVPIPAPVAPHLTHTLVPGDKDKPMVLVLQVLLEAYARRYNAPDVSPQGVDGVFGKNTADAVIAFKRRITELENAYGRDKTFPTLDSAVGPVTLGALQWWVNA